MEEKDILALYQSNADFKRYVDHWAKKIHEPAEKVMMFSISKLYADQLLNKEEEVTYEYEIRQDNGI